MLNIKNVIYRDRLIKCNYEYNSYDYIQSGKETTVNKLKDNCIINIVENL